MLLGLVSIGVVLIGVGIVSTGWVLAATLLETLKKAAQKTDPIPLPNGRKPATLKWQAAMEALILSAEHGQPGADPMTARIAMMRALNREKPKAAPRRKRAKAYHIVR